MKFYAILSPTFKKEERELDEFLEKLYDKVEKLEQDLKAFEKAIAKSF